MAAPPRSVLSLAEGRLGRIAETLERLEAEQGGRDGDGSQARRLLQEAAAELSRARHALAHEHEASERARLDGALLVARTAAHQLNNALSPIVGYAELLDMLPSVRNEPTARSYVALISESATVAADLVQRLQRIVRLEEAPSPLGPDKPLLDLDRSAS